MKTLNLLLLISILLVGCRSTKKLTESKVQETAKTEVVQKNDVKVEEKVNNDKTTYKKTTITETEFDTSFKPNNEPEVKNVTNERSKPESKIKAIRVTVIEEGTADKTKTETKITDNSQTNTKTSTESKVENSVKEQKKIPIKWGFIFGILVIVIGGSIYLVKSPAGKTALTFIKKIFG